MSNLEPTVRSRSRDNTLFKEVRKLAHDSTAYRKAARVWLEGEHLRHRSAGPWCAARVWCFRNRRIGPQLPMPGCRLPRVRWWSRTPCSGT